MPELLTLVRLNRDNSNAIESVECRRQNGTYIKLSAGDMRECIVNGTFRVDGLEVNGRGLQDTRGRHQQESSSDTDARLMQELVAIKRMLTTQSNTLSNVSGKLSNIRTNTDTNLNLAQELESIRELLSSTQQEEQSDWGSLEQRLDALETKLDDILRKQQFIKSDLRYGQDSIKRRLDDLGIKNEKDFKELREKIGYLFSGKTIEGTISYPRCKQDLNKDLVYYPNDITLSKEAFDSAVGGEQYCPDYDYNGKLVMDSNNNVIKGKAIFNVEYDEEIFSTLRGHIEVVNNFRIVTEEAFVADINSNNLGAMNSCNAEMFALVNDVFISNCVVGGSLKLAAQARHTGKLKKFMVSIFGDRGSLGEKVNIENHRVNTLKDSDDRMAGIYNQFAFLKVDKQELLNSADNADAYSTDLRVFVLNCCGSMVTRSFKDINMASNIFDARKPVPRSKPYHLYVNGSLALTPITSDECMFNFYCLYYLSKLVGNTSNMYAQSQTGLSSHKAYMDIFINAYFAAKKSILYAGNDILELLDNINHDLRSVKSRLIYGEFLLRVKIGLVIQGMRLEKAEWMMQLFLKISDDFEVYKDKEVSHRGSDVTWGFDVK